MGDRENAAAALAHMPNWVAVHDITLAKFEVVLALAMNEGLQLDDLWDDLNQVRADRDRAVGVSDLNNELQALSEEP